MPITYGFSSRNSRVGLGAGSFTGAPTTYLYARKWTLGVMVDELDVSTFEEYGFTNCEDGLMSADVSFDGFWDSRLDGSLGAVVGSTATNLPPVLYPGAVLTHAKFFVKGANQGTTNGLGVGLADNSVFYYFPELKLFGATVDAEVRNTLNVSFNAKSRGRFYFPGHDANAVPLNVRNIWH